MAVIPKKTISSLRPATKRVLPDKEKTKATSALYNSRWHELSVLYRNAHPLCERCQAKGRIVPAVMVHHKKPVKEGGGLLDWDNLQALCWQCHQILHHRRPGVRGVKSLAPM